MYHIHNDKRTRESAELIFRSLLTLIEQKPFEDITITDIQRTSGVARSTFYRSFDNLSDVLTWKCEQAFRESFESCPASSFRNETLLLTYYFGYWMEHSEILELLIKIDRTDIFYASHFKTADELQAKFGENPMVPDEYKEYFLATRSGITISILSVWIRRGKRESVEELTDIIRNQTRILEEGFPTEQGGTIGRFQTIHHK